MVTMIVGIGVVAATLVYRVSMEPSGSTASMTEISIDEGLRVVRVDHSQPDRLVLVLRDGTGQEVVRIYRTVNGAPPRYDGPVEAD